MFPGPLSESITGRALKENIWRLDAVDIRDYAKDKHRSVDDTPAGGGAGMVMRADILGDAIDAHWSAGTEAELIYVSPRGEPFTQNVAHEFANKPGAVVLCGRFEGIDQRVLEARPVREISIGDYVLSGGELAAMVMFDAIVRLLPGVVGDEKSLAEESFEQGLLEYPHYTRPQTWEGRDIPEVLTSGHHGKIAKWRQDKSEECTQARRPDLWKEFLKRNRAEK